MNLVSNANNQLINEVDTTMNLELFGSQYQVSNSFDDMYMIKDIEEFLPKMSSTQYNMLKENIDSIGVKSPVVFARLGDKKIVIDGHLRLSIAKELNLAIVPTYETKEVFNSIEEVKIWMVRNQSQQRNVPKNVRVKLAYTLKDSIASLAKNNLVLAGKSEEVISKVDTLQEIANVAGVSRSTIARYQSVLTASDEKLKQQMEDGEISINSAYEQLKSDADTHSSIPDEVQLKPNYVRVSTVKDGTHRIKSGDLDCLLIVKKGKENLVSDTNYKTGLLVMD